MYISPYPKNVTQSFMCLLKFLFPPKNPKKCLPLKWQKIIFPSKMAMMKISASFPPMGWTPLLLWALFKSLVYDYDIKFEHISNSNLKAYNCCLRRHPSCIDVLHSGSQETFRQLGLDFMEFSCINFLKNKLSWP